MNSKVRIELRVLLWICSSLSLVNSPLAKANAIIVPNYMANEYGANNVAPFDIAAIYDSSMRYQEMFDASQFGNVVAGGEYITQIAFRAGSLDGPFTASIQNIQFDLTTTANTSLSLTFADNVGADDTTVFSGSWSFSSAGAAPGRQPAGGPAPAIFDIVLNLTTPFFYNPANGNLVLDLRNFSGGQTAYFDAAFQSNPSGAVISSVWAGDAAATSTSSGQSAAVGPVAQFTFRPNPVPEPSAMGLELTCLGFLLTWRFSKTSRNGMRGHIQESSLSISEQTNANMG